MFVLDQIVLQCLRNPTLSVQNPCTKDDYRVQKPIFMYKIQFSCTKFNLYTENLTGDSSIHVDRIKIIQTNNPIVRQDSKKFNIV